MVRLVVGYVMKPETTLKIAENMGYSPNKKTPMGARLYINRYIREHNPKFPVFVAADYPPFKGEFLAYVLVTRYEDGDRNREFKERPLDRKVSDILAKLGGMEQGDNWWWGAVVHRW
ncbi:hypothetical protein EYR40_008244 [Pleurotus pulmonarius]|nr:hypothetical protein EYR36_009066 [Pleurotus pulmonarius]KAF4597777.1 hypothetical protein EYR40_008244 [Pleurotus pulmonarius]